MLPPEFMGGGAGEAHKALNAACRRILGELGGGESCSDAAPASWGARLGRPHFRQLARAWQAETLWGLSLRRSSSPSAMLPSPSGTEKKSALARPPSTVLLARIPCGVSLSALLPRMPRAGAAYGLWGWPAGTVALLIRLGQRGSHAPLLRPPARHFLLLPGVD